MLMQDHETPMNIFLTSKFISKTSFESFVVEAWLQKLLNRVNILSGFSSAGTIASTNCFKVF